MGLQIMFTVQISLSTDHERDAFKHSVTDSAGNLQAHIAVDDAMMSALIHTSAMKAW